MRSKRFVACLLVPAIAGMVSVSCEQQVPPVPQAEEEPLLLLEEGDSGADQSPPKGPVADNSRCHVCHMNYQDEELAVSHANADIGCEKCHGASDAHCGDEDNVTPPDIMYAKTKINPSCMTCHPRTKIDTQAHKLAFEALTKGKKVCTDCHGKHRLSHRTRRWDKTTGKLIDDDKVRMIRKPPPKKP